MKKLLLLLSFLMFSSLSINAQMVNLQANCFVNRGSVAYCEACNYNYRRPLFCQMNIQGQTRRGFSLQGFQGGLVQSGLCIRGQVFAKNPFQDPLLFANAFVSCHF